MTVPTSPDTDHGIEGRWTIFVCTGCGEATGRHKDCDAKREATEVVPCGHDAMERAAQGIADALGHGLVAEHHREWAAAALRAAADTPIIAQL